MNKLLNWQTEKIFAVSKKTLQENNIDAFFDCEKRVALFANEKKISEFDKIFIEDFCK